MNIRKFLLMIAVLFTLTACMSEKERAEYESYKRQKKGFETYQQSIKNTEETNTNRTRPKQLKEIPLYDKYGFESQRQYDEGLNNILTNGLPGLTVHTYSNHVEDSYGVTVAIQNIPSNNCNVYVDDMPQYQHVDGKCIAVYNQEVQTEQVEAEIPIQEEEVTEIITYQGSFGDVDQLNEQQCFGSDPDGYYLTWLGRCVIMTPENEVMN